MEPTSSPAAAGPPPPGAAAHGGDRDPLVEQLRRLGPKDGARALAGRGDAEAARLLEDVGAPQSVDLLAALPAARRDAVRGELDPELAAQWERNAHYAADSLGRMMEPPAAVHRESMTVAEAVTHLREEVKRHFITYLYVVDGEGRLVGLVVMREMLLARPDDTLGDIMLREPFTFRPEARVKDAMKEAAARHFPVYPICDEDGRLIGLVRGEDLFEQNMFSIIVQAGSMVGVEKEERVTTAWQRSLRMRHPWLLLNLLTAVVAGAVVGLFEDTIAKVVALAAFLPVLAGQSGNTGCQALAVTLRGMTLGDLAQRRTSSLILKEAFVGLLNGAIIGLIAAVLMYFYALQSSPEVDPLMLSFVVWLAMTGSCVASGVSGTLVPVALDRMGADPCTASSIFLTTATDVVSMGLLLGLASLLIL